ncbi:MAG TPA: polysaccharide biosynthesis/export family protein [Planctomycetota bacterium]|nr:polysaccharide biosynthesis/export family protein [Planctomycetota bacterium]
MIKEGRNLRCLFRILRGWGGVALLAALSSCGTEDLAAHGFTVAPPPRPYSPDEFIKQFDASTEEPYRLGEGDQVSIQVWEKPELSGSQAVGPDGVLTVPLVGSIRVSGLTRDEASKAIHDSLSKIYSGVVVSLKVDQYVGNRVTVVGRVKTQGVLRFESVPTLLEAIGRAGGLVEGTVNLTHCAVMRGRDRLAWIDLAALMDGRDLSLNLRLKPGDLVLVPEDGDQPVYVLGEVTKSGPLRWFRGMTVVDALAQAGGTTKDAMSQKIVIVRPSRNQRVVVSRGDILDPQVNSIIGLERGDIVYVPSSYLADLGYILQQLQISSWVFYATFSNNNNGTTK